MSLQLPWLQTYSGARLLALVVIPSLTARTIIDLAMQVERSKSFRRLLWLVGGSIAVALGVSCTMELSTGQVAGAYPMAVPDHLFQLASVFAGCVWTLVTLARKRPRTVWVLATSLALALGFAATGNVAAMFRMRENFAADGLSVVSFLVAAAASYLFLKIGALAKTQIASRRFRGIAATLLMGLLMAGSLVFVFQAAKVTSIRDAQDYLAGGLPLTALCFGTCAMLVIALAAASISRQDFLRSTELQQNMVEQRTRDALADQRVTRLQNEALLQEIQERKRAEEKLRYAAFHDPATGLENRASVTIRLNALLEQRGSRRPLRAAVILIRLNDLGTVNALIGRSTADLVLLEITKRLQRFVADDHTLARVGDDEFLILMSRVPTQEHAIRKANLILSSMEDAVAVDNAVVNLSASIGLCAASPIHMRADEVLRDVDLAVQVATREGGRQCKIFDSTMRDEALEVQQRKRELKTAMQQEQFVLFYQPLVDMRDRSIYGMEALIRWEHPTKGLVGPGAFIPMAEETGQILDIGTWTLRRACQDFVLLEEHSQKDLLLSVNVSPRQLSETPFLKLLHQVLSETSMPPAQLQLELTESIFLKDAPSVGALLQEIRSMGIKIAFDDFGTGYSSLSYLTRYPIDTLKVDQSFVRGMNQSSGGENLVMFMMGLAQEFNMSVTAEGVEQVEQEAALLLQGCCFAQGYFYSRPIPVDAMIALLRQGLQISPNADAVKLQAGNRRPFLTPAVGLFRSPNTH